MTTPREACLEVLADAEATAARARNIAVMAGFIDEDSIKAFGARRSNAEAILDCRKLGFWTEEDLILDMTYGKGRFWKITGEPPHLWRGDLNPRRSPDFPEGLDATNTGLEDRSVEVAVCDPPYKLNGTPSGGGPASSDEDYGVEGTRTMAQRHELMTAMCIEACRIANRRVIYKCQTQVCSGRKRNQVKMILDTAEAHGFRFEDELFVEGHREQPSGRKQRHAHQDFSSMLVLRRVGR